MWCAFQCRRWRRFWAARNRSTPIHATRLWDCPLQDSARLALRTQQIIANETGVVNTADPLGGSEYIEKLTDDIERGAADYIRRIDAMGGTLAAIERNYIQNEIQNAAYEFQQAIENGEQSHRGREPIPAGGERSGADLPD